MKLLILTAALSMPATLIGGTTSCTPAQQAEATQIENVVYTDFAAGDTLEQIETAVAAIVLPGNAGADIVILVNDAITLIIDSGVLSALDLAKIRTMQAALVTKHIAGLKR